MTVDGTFEIVEMELWSKEDIDLVEVGDIQIKGNKGTLQFICVTGIMDIRKSRSCGYKFSWDGNDELDPVSGFGEFTCDGDTLTGRIYMHNGDDSQFVARRIQKP